MRDDNAIPRDREDADRTNAANLRHAPPSDAESLNDQSADAASDSPAPLSALSHPADVEEASLTDDEIALYRRRVAEGLYNSREVADEVARRMMRRGDI
jgi:hypothetical protein